MLYFSTMDLDAVQGLDSVEQVRNQKTSSEMITMKGSKTDCRAVSGVEPFADGRVVCIKGKGWDKG